MDTSREVKNIDLSKLTKVVVVDREYYVEGREYDEAERTTLYEDDTDPRNCKYYVHRHFINECLDDECVFDVTDLVATIEDNEPSTQEPLEEYIDLKTTKAYYEDKFNYLRRDWLDRNWRIMYEGYTEEEYDDMYPERPIEL